MKNIKINLICFAVCLVFSITSTATDINNPMQQFNPWLKTLDDSLSSAKSGNEAVSFLLENPKSRVAAFNLQALGKIYSKIDPDFKIVKENFKIIEDGLGQIDKWRSLKNNEKIKIAVNNFSNLLQNKHFFGTSSDSQINQTRLFLENKFQSFSTEQKDFLKLLSLQLNKLQDTHFDFSHLEEGDGLHEFRRQVRWFLIESQVLTGLLKFKDDSFICPIKSFENLLSLPIAKSKYSQLKEINNAYNQCPISRCLYLSLADQVEKIGEIKDKVELTIGNTNSDMTPSYFKNQAEQLYKNFITTGVLKLLSSEIQGCIN